MCFSLALPNPWCLSSAVYLNVYVHTCIGCGDDEYGRPGEMSMEEVDILLFIPDLESKDGLCWIKEATDLMLEVGEKSSVWDTDLLRPRKSGALLGEFSSNEKCNAYRRVDML